MSIKLGELTNAAGSHRKPFRVGRGHASGNGKWSGRGHGGQKSRTGGGVRPGFEGGQMPLYRRIPKRGFKCRNTKDIVAINLSLLSVFQDGDVVDIDMLKSKGLVSNVRDGVKILANGDFEKKLTVKAHYFSEDAKASIESHGGSVEVIPQRQKWTRQSAKAKTRGE